MRDMRPLLDCSDCPEIAHLCANPELADAAVMSLVIVTSDAPTPHAPLPSNAPIIDMPTAESDLPLEEVRELLLRSVVATGVEPSLLTCRVVCQYADRQCMCAYVGLRVRVCAAYLRACVRVFVRLCVRVFVCACACARACMDVRWSIAAALLLRMIYPWCVSVTRTFLWVFFFNCLSLKMFMKVPTTDDGAHMPTASLWHMAIASAASNTQATAVFGPDANARMSYGDLLMQSLRVVQGLRRAGVHELGAAVGVCVGRGPLAVISAFALLV